MMRFAALLVLALSLHSTAAAQSAKMPRIGFVTGATSIAPEPPSLRAFRAGMHELGYVEGRDFAVEARGGEGRPDLLAQHFAEMVRLKVDVLVAGSVVGALAAKKATSTIPIVFAGVLDPLAPGIVPSFAHPGGNITGTTFGVGGSEIAGKWVELLKEAAPGLSRMAVLSNSRDPQTAVLLREIQVAAHNLKVADVVYDVAAYEGSLDKVLAAIGAARVDGMIVVNSILFASNDTTLVRFAAAQKIPAIYFFNQFADKGGLMSYGGNLEDTYRRAATFVVRILKGAKPGELPIDQPTKFELVVNQKAARALGLGIPHSLLLRADRVIE